MFEIESTPEQVERQKLLQNRAWLDENIDGVQKEYSEQWIAILDGSVAYHDNDAKVVERSVGKRYAEAVIIQIPSGAIQTPI
jgi:hypothetical protein